MNFAQLYFPHFITSLSSCDSKFLPRLESSNDSPGFFLDSKPPELDFTSTPRDKSGGDVTFFWRSKENTNFKCGTDSNNLKACGTGQLGNQSLANLTDGEHDFYVEATDEFGNTIRIVHTWTVGRLYMFFSNVKMV